MLILKPQTMLTKFSSSIKTRTYRNLASKKHRPLPHLNKLHYHIHCFFLPSLCRGRSLGGKLLEHSPAGSRNSPCAWRGRQTGAVAPARSGPPPSGDATSDLGRRRRVPAACSLSSPRTNSPRCVVQREPRKRRPSGREKGVGVDF